MATKFKTKPVEIDAVQWDGYNLAYILGFMGKQLDSPRTDEELDAFRTLESKYRKLGLQIQTLEETIKASVGDWIIKGHNEEFYSCKPDIFEMKYEPIIK